LSSRWVAIAARSVRRPTARGTTSHCRTTSIIALMLATLATLAAGCRTPEATRSPVAHYVDSTALQTGSRRVLFVPLANETSYPVASAGMTSALFESVQGRRLFQLTSEVPSMGPDGNPFSDNSHMLSLKDLAQIRRQTNCDAVLLGAVTCFSPYPSLRIGLYLRLVGLRDSRVLWSVDQVWDSTDKATQKRIERYFHDERGDAYDPIQWHLATVSPAALQQFVAYEVAQTLPCPADAAERP